MMCTVDLEPCDVWAETHVGKARKEYECDCCNGTIPIGAGYIRHFSIFEGNVTHEKMCLKCEAVAKAFNEDHGQRGTPSSMVPLLDECVDYGDDDSKKWKRALSAMRARGRKRRFAPNGATP